MKLNERNSDSNNTAQAEEHRTNQLHVRID